MDTSRAWIRNPFEVSLPVPQLSFHEQEQLIELSSDGALQLQFKRKPLVDFWTESLTSHSLGKASLESFDALRHNVSLPGWFLCYGSS